MCSNVNFVNSMSYFNFREATINEVRNAINGLKTSKSFDIFGLNSSMIKDSKDIIIGPITKLFNSSIKEKEFPNILKIAKIIPIFKKGDPSDPSNYRPISILPIVSNIFEVILKNQLTEYLETNNILSGKQYGFRKGLSTKDAISDFTDWIIDCFEDGLYATASFLDLSKAFDCVSHEILIRKLYAYNIHPDSCRLLSSYLKNRRQTVLINGNCSKIVTNNAGVPQGSVLGPILFLLYINDLPSHIQDGNIVLFADDTTLTTKGNDMASIEKGHQTLISAARNWFECNKLCLNTGKTQKVHFSAQSQAKHIITNTSTKFLGLNIDSHLKWTSHSEILAKKLARNIFLLRNLASKIARDALKTAYLALCESHMSYGIFVWGHSTILSRIFTLQRRAIRIVAGLNYRDDCRDAFSSLNLLTLPSMYILACLKYIKSTEGRQLRHDSRHKHFTRHRTNIYPNKIRLTSCRMGTNYFAAKFFNIIPKKIRELPTKSFLAYMKAHLTRNVFYNFDDYTGSNFS